MKLHILQSQRVTFVLCSGRLYVPSLLKNKNNCYFIIKIVPRFKQMYLSVWLGVLYKYNPFLGSV